MSMGLASQGHTNMVALTVVPALEAVVPTGSCTAGHSGWSELGHTYGTGRYFCGCGLRGCGTRNYTSGNALEHFARSAVRRRPQEASACELCNGDIDELEGKMVSQAAVEKAMQ